MTPKEQQQYAAEYRREGFGRISDKRYYQRHREKILRRKRQRYRNRREGGMSDNSD